MNTKHAEYIRLARALMTQRTDLTWIPLVRHVLPKLIPASCLAELKDDGLPPRVCAHAQTAILKLAAGHINYITPRGQSWFAFQPSAQGRDKDDIPDAEKEWYDAATRRVRGALEQSNFYTSQIAAIIDRCATGTGLMMVKESKDGLVFSHIPAGTYAIAEDENHVVDTVVRKFLYTAHQAASAWGKENLSKQMLQALGKEDEKYTRNFELWHLTVPRNTYRKSVKDVKNAKERQWADVYIDPQDDKVLFEDGTYEFPYMCSRFIKYGCSPYGQSVLASIQDTIHDSIMMNESLKTAAQRTALPSVLISGSQAGEVDLRAGAMTVVRPEEIGTGMPQAWALAGEYRIGKDLLEMYNNEIDEATFVSVLQVISDEKRPMTATEVTARENERMMTFSQSFTQFVSDFQPFMQRVFNCCFRMGILPLNPPFEVLETTTSGDVKLRRPEVTYMGIMAKALRRAEYQGMMNALGMAMQFAQALQSPEPLDAFKLFECVRVMVNEEMVPEDCLRSKEETEKRASDREAAMQQAGAAQLALQEAQASRENAQADQIANQL